MMFPSFMNVVGSTAVAVTVTVLTPVAALTAEVKNSAAAVGSPGSVPRYWFGKFALKTRAAAACGLPLLSARAARQRRAVDRLGQLRLDHVGPARVDGDAGAEQQHGQRHRHVDERKPVVPSEDAIGAYACPCPFQKYAIEYSVSGTWMPNRSNGVIS